MELQSNVKILLVDDQPENLLALEALLGGLDAKLVRATSGEEALRSLLYQEFAVILMDVQMPNMDGFEAAELIRHRPKSRQTPIIFLTALNSDQKMFQGYACGAVDYLQKPVDSAILLSKVAVFVELFKKTEALKHQAAQLIAVNAELRKSEERFRSLSTCSPIGIFVTDSEGHCTYTNPRCQAICQLSIGDRIDESWLQSVYPIDRDRAIANWRSHLHEGGEYSDEFRVELAYGTIGWVHVSSAPMLSADEDLLGYVGTLEDVTARKQAELDRVQMVQEQLARQEAESSNRLKDEFLAILSHELRTPLNAVLGWARLLRSRSFDAAARDRALETIERNAAAQASMVEEILDISKIIQGKLSLKFGMVNLEAIVSNALQSVRPAADAKGIELTAVLDAPGGNVWGDPARLQQVVGNLLSNAVKFTPQSGNVEVRVERRCGSDSFNLQKLAYPPSLLPQLSEHVQIQVVDTGIGISADVLPIVFDQFRQADSSMTRPFGGLGLGLAIVRHLVELNGGQVEATSAGEGLGATFTVKLPLWQDAKLVAPDAHQANAQRSNQGSHHVNYVSQGF
ncbi:response regulator [Myxacorys almedinensis A]|uniref:Circadian input-output histidine kinase CikA n=2 Tax=Myxacorys TaxID=2056239 RepID=A0A8J7Z413_9CYAN|nr:response regulator [Myxacorys almedinensis A]